jgi:hypothetical protein
MFLATASDVSIATRGYCAGFNVTIDCACSMLASAAIHEIALFINCSYTYTSTTIFSCLISVYYYKDCTVLSVRKSCAAVIEDKTRSSDVKSTVDNFVILGVIVIVAFPFWKLSLFIRKF